MKNITSILLCFILIACSVNNESSAPKTPTADVPNSPTSLAGVIISDVRIRLSWKDKSQNETGFKIERKVGEDAFATIATVGDNVTTFTDDELMPGTTYEYRVSSFN